MEVNKHKQNGKTSPPGIAILIVRFSMPSPDNDLAIVMPVCCFMFTNLPLFIWYIARMIAKRWFGAFGWFISHVLHLFTPGWVDREVKEDERREKLGDKEANMYG